VVRGAERDAERFHCVSAADENATASTADTIYRRTERLQPASIHAACPSPPPTYSSGNWHLRWIVRFRGRGLTAALPRLLRLFTEVTRLLLAD